MLKVEHVPEEVLKALAASMNCDWALQTDEDRRVLAEHAAAVINAWPGAVSSGKEVIDGETYWPVVWLPLSRDMSDD